MAPRKHYKQEQMNNAIEAVRNGLNVFTAAQRFGVPRITLRNKITGISPLVCGMGPPSILTNEQEKFFVDWVHRMSDKHCPVGKEHLLNSVQYFVTFENIVNPFTDNRPGKKWYYSFSKRNPQVADRISGNWWKSKDNINEKKIKSWFTNIKHYLKKKKLQHVLKDPRRIFTSDEAAFYLNPKQDRVLVKRNETNIYSVVGNEREHPKVYLTANAAGESAPPMVLFSYQHIPKYISESIPEEWGIGSTKIGWMSSTTLYEYMTNIFHPWLIESGIKLPVIYFLDGEATHLTMQLSEFCAENQIELLSLYPNSNHILRTMDVAIFHPLKAFWKRRCTMWKLRNFEQQIRRENFAPILERALMSITSDCIRNGFKISGLFPFTPKNIDFTKLNSVNRSKVLTSTQFLNTLEREIVQHFTHEKLDAFNTYFHNKKSENDLPKEDIALYAIWSKYKQAYPAGAINHEEMAADSSIPKSKKRSRLNSPEYETRANNETFVKTRQSSSERENNSKEIESEDDEPAYLNLSRDSSETTPSKHLPTTLTRRFSQNKTKTTPMKRTLRWLDETSKKPARTVKKPATLTIKTWREENRRQSEKEAILCQKDKIKQEPVSNRKRVHDIELKQKAKRRQKTIKKRRKISISYEDDTETEESVTEYYSEADESTDTKDIPDIKDIPDLKDIIDKKYMNDNTEELQRALSPLDIVKRKMDDDSVIICVTDEDVKILYY